MEGASYQDDAYNGYAFLSMGDSIFKDLSVKKSFDRAIFFYDKAIKTDSTFALAYAKRAITRAWGFNAGHFTAKDHMDKCRNDIEQALHYDGGLSEGQIAYGFYYYYFLKDYAKSLEYFRNLSVKEPWNWQCKYYMALVLRASGDWDQSQTIMAEVGGHNIRDPLFLTNIGLSYQAVHQYDTAIIYHDRAIQLMPGWSAPYHNKIQSLILRDGNTSEAEIVLDTAVSRTTGGMFPWMKIDFDLYNGKFKEALFKAEVADPTEFPDRGTRYLVLAEIHRLLNNDAIAGEYYKNALEFLMVIWQIIR
jgi:tetratricopeptide (TPR) repeat protein